MRRQIDLEATAKLLETIQEKTDDIMNENISRTTVLEQVAKRLREKDIRLSRNYSAIWKQVDHKWRKI